MLRTRLLPLAVATLAIGAAAPAPAAPPLRLCPIAPAGAPVADGSRLVAWPGAGSYPAYAAEPFDVASRVRTTLAPPEGCGFADISAASEVLWSCGGSARVQNLVTGEEQLVAEPPGLATLSGSGYFSGIGERWLVFAVSRYHAGPSFHYVSRRTGRVIERTADRHRRIDVDTASLTHPLCRGMVRPLVPDDSFSEAPVPGNIPIAGRRAAVTTYRETPAGNGTYTRAASVKLQGCRERPRTLQYCPPPTSCSEPVIDGRIVAWMRDATDSATTSTLYVRSLRTGLTRSTITGRARSQVPAAPLLAGGHLFVVADRTLSEVVY